MLAKYFILTLLIHIACGMSLFQNWFDINITSSHENDPKLLNFVKRHIYSTTGEGTKFCINMCKETYNKSYQADSSWQYIKKVLKLLYEEGAPGFYVEAGGMDGEYLSHSLYLEKELNWRGLVVEPSKVLFNMLRKSKRKAMISDLCVAKGNLSYQDILQNNGAKHRSKRLLLMDIYGGGTLLSSPFRLKSGHPGDDNYDGVTCVPLSTILEATGEKHINVILLDVNGLEFDIVNNFSFGKYEIDVWIVRNRNQHQTYLAETFDFKLIKRFAECGYAFYSIGYKDMDYIMVNIKSKIYDKAIVKRPLKWWDLIKYFAPLYPPLYHNIC